MGGTPAPPRRRRAWRLVAAALSLLALAGASAARASGPEPAGPLVAPYLWGGLLDGPPGPGRFHRSLGFLLDRGFSAVRIAVSPNTLAEIGVEPGRCPPARGIACAVRAALADPVFDRPELAFLMITLHEHAARGAVAEGPDGDAGRRARAEFAAALDALAERFAGRRGAVRLVVSNWEGDNLAYCGSVQRYARDPDFAARCDAPAGDGVDRRLRNLAGWVAGRDAAVAEVLDRHPGLALEHAPEFNIAYLGPRNCRTRCDPARTVFEALTRGGPRPLCSYSAYNSTNRAALEEDLLRLLAGCGRLIVGELGFAEARGGADRAAAGFARAAAAIARAAPPGRIPAVVVWNAFAEPGRTREDSFGLFRSDGSPALVRALPPALAPGGAR